LESSRFLRGSGERGRNRTYNLLIKSTCRTQNQQLAPSAMNCDQVLPMPCPVRLSSDALTLGSSWWGLVVGTKLGTVGTLAFQPQRSLPARSSVRKCGQTRTMLCGSQGVKKGGGWGVVRYVGRSANFFRLLGSCSRDELAKTTGTPLLVILSKLIGEIVLGEWIIGSEGEL
jgi:hypothetical protein